jgi:hypothetical protein
VVCWGGLGRDVFQYYGLGCRNISKIFVREEEQIQAFFRGIEGFNRVIDHHKYSNNYDYNKSIYLVNGASHLDNGFLLLRESEELVSPISVLYYEVYEDLDRLEENISANKEKIQCLVSRNGWYRDSLPFGTAQTPGIMDYADNVDTMKFLLDLAVG